MTYLPRNRQKLCTVENIAHAIGIVAERRWPDSPTGNLSKAAKISKTEAANIRKGHGSGKKLAGVLKTLGMSYSLEVLEIIVGVDLEEHLTIEHEKAKQRERNLGELRGKRAANYDRQRAFDAGLRGRMAG